MSDNTTGEMRFSQELIVAIKEAMHYYLSGSDCFSVSIWPWKIKYDESIKSASYAKGDE